MSETFVRPSRRSTGDEPVTEELLVSDLLGFAGYLAEAVESRDVQLDLARAELADAVVTDLERRALSGAARRAATLGDESLRAALLRSAVDGPPEDANVA